MGFWEIILIVVVVLLVFSPKQIPVLARHVGRFVGQWRRLWQSLQE